MPVRIWTNLSSPAKAALLGSLLAPLALLGWRLINPAPDPPRQSAANTFVMGKGDWMTDWASDLTGARLGRRLTLYRPSLKLADYRMEFTGRMERESLGWVYRASSTRNYYGARLEIVRPGSFPTLALSRFSVIDGREVSHGRKLIPVMLAAGAAYRVRFEAQGPKFTLWLQGQIVDMWEDGKLKLGGAGFFNERQEQGKILDFRLVVQK